MSKRTSQLPAGGSRPRRTFMATSLNGVMRLCNGTGQRVRLGGSLCQRLPQTVGRFSERRSLLSLASVSPVSPSLTSPSVKQRPPSLLRLRRPSPSLLSASNAQLNLAALATATAVSSTAILPTDSPSSRLAMARQPTRHTGTDADSASLRTSMASKLHTQTEKAPTAKTLTSAARRLWPLPPLPVSRDTYARNRLFELLDAVTGSQLPLREWDNNRSNGSRTVRLRVDTHNDRDTITVTSVPANGVNHERSLTLDSSHLQLNPSTHQPDHTKDARRSSFVNGYATNEMTSSESAEQSTTPNVAEQSSSSGTGSHCSTVVEEVAQQFANFSRYNVLLEHTGDMGTIYCPLAVIKELSPQSPPSNHPMGMDTVCLSTAQWASTTLERITSNGASSPQVLNRRYASPYQHNMLIAAYKLFARHPSSVALRIVQLPLFMMRTLLQFFRPFMAFSLMGEVMKVIAVSVSNMGWVFLFSMVLGIEVAYLFLQCYIAYLFLSVFFSSIF